MAVEILELITIKIRKDMKIPFTLDAWLKDKSQKVETRDGRLVHNIWQIKEPPYTNNRKAEVCALIDGEEDALVFFEGGRYLPTTKDTDNPFDLFIITTEPEPSEFEKGYMRIVHKMKPEDFNDEGLKIVKEEAAELLELSRKELEKEEPNIIEARSYKSGLKQGKVETLKDLPKWEKCASSFVYGNVDNGVLFYKYRYIHLSDLEKLPGFNE